MTSQAATTGAGPVQGPAAPTRTDLIWATASSQAALDDPHATLETRLAALEAEAATYTAAAHLGVDDATAEEYAAELAAWTRPPGLWRTPGLRVPGRVERGRGPAPEPEAGL